MPVNEWLVGFVALIFITLVAQLYFHAQIRRKYGVLRPLRQRALLGPSWDERQEMFRSLRRRHDDPRLERARWLYIAAFAFTILFGLWALLTNRLP